jgi:hypothetical protein
MFKNKCKIKYCCENSPKVFERKIFMSYTLLGNIL